MSWIELVAQRRPPSAPPGMTPPENAKDWFRIENSVEDEDTTDIFVYDSIGGWFGMYADEFIEALGQVSTKNVKLRLNSPGGSVFEGIAIANAIRMHPANVTVYVDSLAASIASIIALSGDKLVMMPQSQLMIHDASGGCYGNAAEMEYMRNLLEKQSDNIASAYADAAGGTKDEWRARMKDETWFTAEEAVAIGLADEVMKKPKKNDDASTSEDVAVAARSSIHARMTASWDLSAYRYAGRSSAPAPLTNQVTEKEPEAANDSALSGLSRAELVALIREAVRAELTVIEGTACPSHTTAVKDGTWDAGANEGHLPSPVPLATVKKMYAYYDEDKVEDGNVPKSACKLPHHFVSADGTPGAASINGVRNALARLPQTEGLSDEERSAAEAHLRKHLNAFSGGDEEDHVHEEVGDHSHSHEHVEDASKKSSPSPDEDEQEPDGDEDEPEGEPEQEPDEDDAPSKSSKSSKTSKNSADDWSQLVDRLTTTTSPSADDVFNRLKEAW